MRNKVVCIQRSSTIKAIPNYWDYGKISLAGKFIIFSRSNSSKYWNLPPTLTIPPPTYAGKPLSSSVTGLTLNTSANPPYLFLYSRASSESFSTTYTSNTSSVSTVPYTVTLRYAFTVIPIPNKLNGGNIAIRFITRNKVTKSVRAI